MEIIGYCKKLNEKNGQSKRGKWTLYSAIFEKSDGTETPWVSFGFDKPPIEEGGYYKVGVEEKDGRLTYVAGSGSKVDAPVAAKSTPSAPSKSEGTGTNRDDAIQYQSSRKDALQLVSLLLEHDALPLSASSTKAGTAKRFDEIKAMVDKLTVELFHDIHSGRVLLKVVDAGAEQESTGDAAPSGTADESDDE